jgi:outer membrane protein assembly factor BamB
VYVPSGNGRITAIDGGTGAVRWTSQSLGAFTSPPTIDGDFVIVSGEDKHVWGLDVASGTTLWSFIEDDWGIGAPLVHEGVVYFGTEGGTVYAIDEHTRAERWRFIAGGHAHANLALSGGVLFFWNGPTIFALDAARGTELWRKTRDAGAWFSVTVNDGVAYAIGSDGLLSALDASSGAERWHVAPPAGAEFWTSAAIWNGMVITSNDAHQVVAFDAATGLTRWTYPASAVATEVFVADAVAYFGAGESVVALEAATGNVLFIAPVNGTVVTAVAIGDGGVFAVTSRGLVVAIR